MKGIDLIYLSQNDVVAAGGLDMAQAVRAVEDAIGLHANGDCILPSKLVLRWGGVETENTTGRINAMPAYVGGSYQMAGIKWISGFPMNPARYDLPRASGLIILNNVETGLPVAVMDGTLVSAMRTGAVTGVAAKYLARPDSEVAGLIGAGVQNRTQLRAILTVLPGLRRAIVNDVSAVRAQRFANEMSAELGIPVDVEADPKQVARQSDVLVTATTALDPIVHEGWWREGAFYAHVGSYQECTHGLVREADKVVVDNWDELVHRGTQTVAKMHLKGLFSRSDLHAELGEIITRRVVGRTSDSERIHFSAIGMAIEDVAVATLIYRRAVASNQGQHLMLWETPHAV